MAKEQAGVWGIDVGQCALKAIRLEMLEGQVTATAFDYVEHPKILSQPDAEPDQLTREALEKFLSRNSLKGDVVAIAVPGQSGLARFVKLPPVEEKKISDIVRFEAKQQIPFPLNEVIWDYQKIGSGVVTGGFAMETEIGLFAMKRDMINRALQQFKDVNVEVQIVQMAPLALCNFVSYDLLKKGSSQAEEADGQEGATKEEEGGLKRQCIVALDIGTDNSNLVITDGERIIWQRPIPHGGNHFTRALTKDLKLTFAKAEHLKRNATKSPDLKKILSSLKPVLNDFVGEVQRSLGYFTNTHRNAQIAYMVGLGNAFRLPGLQKFLSEKLQMEVRKLQKLERLAGDSVVTAPAFTQNVPSFAVVYGLALQGLGRTRLHTNLLPHDIRVERLVRAKKPWAVTAAAALLLGATSLAGGYALQYNAVAAKPVTDAVAAGNGVITYDKKYKDAYAAKLRKILDDENSVRSIIAGQDERLDWVLLNEYINKCLPLPALRIDGKFKGLAPAKNNAIVLTDAQGKERLVQLDQYSRIIVHKNGQDRFGKDWTEVKIGDPIAVVYQSDSGAQKYWNAKAQDAYLAYWQRQTEGKTSDSTAEDKGIEDLIQVNIEFLGARYTGNLAGYWENVKKDPYGKLMEGMLEKDKKDGPSDQGWVVEIRGYTYHGRPTLQFLKDTLVRKLATLALAKQEQDKGAAQTAAGTAQPPAQTPKVAASANAKPEGKQQAEDQEQLWKKIIEGRVSHVFVYRYMPVRNPNPAHFQLIGASVLPSLVPKPVGRSTSGTMMGGSGQGITSQMQTISKQMGGTTASSAGGWQSLLGEAGPGTAAGMDTPATAGSAGTPKATTGGTGYGMPTGAGMAKPGAVPPGVPGSNTDVQVKEQDNAKAGPQRTEFIVLFVWKEPTPSDKLLGNAK